MNQFAILVLIGVTLAIASASADFVAGGLGATRPGDKAAQEVLDKIQPKIEEKLGRSFKSLEAISYRTQVVSGMNYFIKALATDKDGSKSHIHVRVYRPFRGEHELTAVQDKKELHHPIEYFQ